MTFRLQSRLSALRPVIEDICAATGAPSVALGVSYKNEKIQEIDIGFRDVEKKLLPNSDTIYGIGSITKLFTASAIGILVDEGPLNWTTPLQEVLPEFHHKNAEVEHGLTISDMLAQKSGLATSNDWWYGADGVLLLEKSQTLSSFSALKSVGPLRTRYDYSNWNYAVLGEVIERCSGQSYGAYLKAKILDPLGMARTSVSQVENPQEHIAVPYAVLDDYSAHKLPFPRSEDGKLMMSTQAIRSTVNDMLKYMNALNDAYHCQLHDGRSFTEDNPLRNVVKQLTGQTPRGQRSMLQKEYCFGFYRNQLPSSFEGLGCNSMFAKQMPTIRSNNEAGLVLSHGGSLAGYTTFATLLPQINCTFTVLVNSIGLGDPAGWINQLLIETLAETSHPNDYVGLAKEAALAHVTSIAQIEHDLKKANKSTPLSMPLEKYVGRYQDPRQAFHVDAKINTDDTTKLDISFQSLDSQVWTLTHYHDDTFLLPMSFNELAKRAIFTFVDEDYFLFTFKFIAETGEVRLYWAHDPIVPADEQYFVKAAKEEGFFENI
ncbi:D-aminoacylase [Penicillium herquei]|nr:D-aminoacylase [Penicillium herquei]